MHPALAILGPSLSMQWVPLPLAAVDAGGLRGAQVHRVVMWWASVLAVTVGTKAAIAEGHDRSCYLEKTSRSWRSLTAASPEKQQLWRGPPVRTGIRKSYSLREALTTTLGGARFLVGKMLEGCWLQSLQTKVTPKGCFSLTLQDPQAGKGFPHLGTGTGMSPSLSPSISLRASAFAEERGKKECVS